jgi:hypothetical protein
MRTTAGPSRQVQCVLRGGPEHRRIAEAAMSGGCRRRRRGRGKRRDRRALVAPREWLGHRVGGAGPPVTNGHRSRQFVGLTLRRVTREATVKFAEGSHLGADQQRRHGSRFWLMFKVGRLTRRYRRGHPRHALAAQSSDANRPVLVHSCCRLGRTANPPSFWLAFTEWLRRAGRSHR